MTTQGGIVQESVLHQGIWRVATYGSLSTEPVPGLYPFLNVFLVRIEAGRCAGNLVRRAIPIGELPLLPINTFLIDGQIAPPLARDDIPKVGEQFKLTIDTMRGRLAVFDRQAVDGKGQLIIPQHTRWATNEPERRSLFVSFETEDDSYGPCIPCVEIFRVFHSPSSVLGRCMLSGWVLEPEQKTWDPERSHPPDERGHAHIHLRARMLDSDAVHVARFAFDHYALKAAQDVFLAAAGRTGAVPAPVAAPRLIRALPPFEQRAELTVQGVRLHLADGPTRILGLRIDRCSYVPPFRSLTYSRDNDGRADDRAGEKRERPPTRSPVFVQPRDITPATISRLLKQPPKAGQTPLQRLQLSAQGLDMPELEKVQAIKLERPPAKTKSPGRRPINVDPADTGSVLPPHGSGVPDADPVIVEGRRLPPQEARTSDLDPVTQDNRRVIQMLGAFTDDLDAEVRFLQVPGFQHAVFEGVAANAFDLATPSRSRWSIIEQPAQRARLVVVARLREASARVRYVIEIEHKTLNEHSTLIVWRFDDRPLDEGSDLKEILDCCQQARGTNISAAVVDGLCWARRRHVEHPGSLAQEAQRLCCAVFDARDHSAR